MGWLFLRALSFLESSRPNVFVLQKHRKIGRASLAAFLRAGSFLESDLAFF